MSSFVYILYSPQADKYYTGMTNDLDGRLLRHNYHHKGFTAQNNDWKIVYFETFETKIEAINREREIKKKKSRIYIENLIKNWNQ